MFPVKHENACLFVSRETFFMDRTPHAENDAGQCNSVEVSLFSSWGKPAISGRKPARRRPKNAMGVRSPGARPAIPL